MTSDSVAKSNGTAIEVRDLRVDYGDFGRVIADETMPKLPNSFGIVALTEAEKEMFECWICDGAPEN